jgi:protein SCO1/2
MTRLCMLVFLCLAVIRIAHALPPDAAALAFRQHPGAAMPLVQGLRDQNGHAVGLADYLGKGPVVFILGYYHCPMLCSTLMDAVLESARGVDVPYEVVAVSIDPSETPDDAARKYAYYSGLMTAGMQAHLHLLTAAPSTIEALTQAVGFPYTRDPDTGQYFHPAGFVVLTPHGRISRYFLGVGYAPRDIELALVEASDGKVGGLADRLVLLCSHFDPRTGRYNVAAMAMARAAGLGTLAALLAGLFLLHRRRARQGRPR